MDINDFSFTTSRDRDVFYTDGLTDDELIRLVEQTGVKTVAIDLEYFGSVWGNNQWAATVSLNQQFRYGWADDTPLRAIAGAVILAFLGEREWDERGAL